VRNYVIDPASLQVDRRVRRAKTDRIDAARLLRSLMAHARGEPKVGSVVRVQALPKRMTVDCIVSVTASSTNAASTHQGPLRRPWHLRLRADALEANAAVGTPVHCYWRSVATAIQGGNQARIAAPGACPSDDQGDRDRARCHCIGKGIDAYQRQEDPEIWSNSGVLAPSLPLYWSAKYSFAHLAIATRSQAMLD
jgi:hypothetical protein